MKKNGWKRTRKGMALLLAAALLTGAAAPSGRGEEAFVFLDEEERADYATPAEASDRRASPAQFEKAAGEPASIAQLRECEAASPSSLLSASIQRISSLGDFWENWDADFSFLDGSYGVGTKEKPYQIRTKQQLMGLSQLTAMGMRVQPGEGKEELIGSYAGAYFKLMTNLDLGGMEWNPIGFYRDSSELSGEVLYPFCAHFDGNGKTISNFRLNQSVWNNVGLFGALEDASVKNLTIKPGKTIMGKNQVGIVAGSARNSKITECSVEGDITASGIAGGIVGCLEGEKKSVSVVENCTARVTIAVSQGEDLFAGGIAGKAAGSSIVDCQTATGQNSTARIQGYGAVVGGITGFQNDTDIYNCVVSGTIGGSGTVTAGGITGLYASGKLKVARFEGLIGQSGLGTAGHRGSFIGHREAGNWFIYGEDVSYLFADTEAKIASDVCGSTIPDDNEYTYAAKIGFSHSGDLFYSLVQGGLSNAQTGQYFYEVLEEGILKILDEDLGGAGADTAGYALDHVAPNDSGRPVRGYLITIPQIDTISGGTNYYDVAVLEARGNHTYYRTLSKERRGAVEAGKAVTVSTAPKHTEEARFQLKGVPTYTEGGREKRTSYVKGGEYTFLMPSENTELRAEYEKVAVKVSVIPSEARFSVIEERTGNRKQPVKTTKVYNSEGRLIASYINGMLTQGTEVQPVTLEAVVDQQNDVADASVKWSLDDPELFTLLSNSDEDAGGYTRKSASLLLNLDAGFFTDTKRMLEEEQRKNQYRYPIPDTIYGAGHQNGGVAILTASTRPSSSFEEKPCTANAKLSVTYQIRDKTSVGLEAASLDKEKLSFTVTRILSGNRQSPKESLTVTEPQKLQAAFSPIFFDTKEIQWCAEDPTLFELEGEGREALLSVKKDAKWIQDLIAAENAIRDRDPAAVLKGSAVRSTTVTIVAEDSLGNRRLAECEAEIHFLTEDQTWDPGKNYGTGSSGGGSSSGGKGAAGSTVLSGNGPAAVGLVPDGAIVGSWSETVNGSWSFSANGRVFREEWGYLYNPYAGEGQSSADWFRFDKDGCLVTGWFTDTDGRRYYLSPDSDGTKGRMLSGWQWILLEDGSKKRYCFNPVSDGSKGCLFWDEALDRRLVRGEITEEQYLEEWRSREQ